MNKKIVICTLYDSVNCGTFLQAYSLKKTLEEKGFETCFLELKNDNSKITKSSYEQKMNLKEILIKLVRKISLQYIFKKSSKKFKTIKLSELNNDKDIKYVVIGSDEIWNVHNKSFVHYREYFGYNFKNKKIIAYAPSANDTSMEDLIREFGDISFKNFDKLSARDEKTKKLLERMGEKNIYEVLDPTMIVNGFEDILEKTKLKNYILVYGHEFSEKQRNEIISFSKDKGLPIISITKYFDWCDKNIIASPGKFLSYIKNANYVITSTFHGSVFSILFEKKFAVYLNNGSKIKDLLNKFELTKQIVNDKSIKDVLENHIDYKHVNNILNSWRIKSTNYLMESLMKGD